ncbi:uncharacterized protein LOC131845754 [Achroia grisella]|uniref:uncharacterized protein LOC131845754 n=1 Tax=Achroia grisella TaxID=688607 RepID=UPI0027D2D968|nr:uncharacterized protein LOC131845754 [Achroia grisella]
MDFGNTSGLRSPFSPRVRQSLSGRRPIGSPSAKKNQSKFLHSSGHPSGDVIYKTPICTVETYGTPLPVIVTETLTFASGEVSARVSACGWCWVVSGRRVVAWPREPEPGAGAGAAREFTLPQTDLAHKADLFALFYRHEDEPGPQMPSCIGVSPEGIVRYWPSIGQEGVYTDVSAELAGQECEQLGEYSRSGLVLATTTCTVVLLNPAVIDGRATVTCRTLRPPSGWLGGIGRRVSLLFFGSMPAHAETGVGVQKLVGVVVLPAAREDDDECVVLVASGGGGGGGGPLLQAWRGERLHQLALRRALADLHHHHHALAPGDLNSLEIMALDVHASGTDGVLLLIATVNIARSPELRYAIAHVSLQEMAEPRVTSLVALRGWTAAAPPRLLPLGPRALLYSPACLALLSVCRASCRSGRARCSTPPPASRSSPVRSTVCSVQCAVCRASCRSGRARCSTPPPASRSSPCAVCSVPRLLPLGPRALLYSPACLALLSVCRASCRSGRARCSTPPPASRSSPVRSTVCSVQCAVCRASCRSGRARCSTPPPASRSSPVRSTVCSVQCAVCSVQCAAPPAARAARAALLPRLPRAPLRVQCAAPPAARAARAALLPRLPRAPLRCVVQCAVCSVQCAAPPAARAARAALLPRLRAPLRCVVQCAVCSVQCAVCSVPRLLPLGPRALLYSPACLALLSGTVPNDKAEVIDVGSDGDRILGAQLCNGVPLLFSKKHGVLVLSITDSLGPQQASCDSPMGSPCPSDMYDGNLSLYEIDPHEVSMVTTDACGKLKTAFLFYLRRETGAWRALVEELFPAGSAGSAGSAGGAGGAERDVDAQLDRTVVSVAAELLDDMPAGDPRWRAGARGAARGGARGAPRVALGSSAALQPAAHLADKRRAFDLLLDFLRAAGLVDRLALVSAQEWGVGGGVVSSWWVLGHLSEQLAAATTLRRLHHGADGQLIEAAIYQVVCGESGEEAEEEPSVEAALAAGALTPSDVFYRRVTRAARLLRALARAPPPAAARAAAEHARDTLLLVTVSVTRAPARRRTRATRSLSRAPPPAAARAAAEHARDTLLLVTVSVTRAPARRRTRRGRARARHAPAGHVSRAPPPAAARARHAPAGHGECHARPRPPPHARDTLLLVTVSVTRAPARRARARDTRATAGHVSRAPPPAAARAAAEHARDTLLLVTVSVTRAPARRRARARHAPAGHGECHARPRPPPHARDTLLLVTVSVTRAPARRRTRRGRARARHAPAGHVSRAPAPAAARAAAEHARDTLLLVTVSVTRAPARRRTRRGRARARHAPAGHGECHARPRPPPHARDTLLLVTNVLSEMHRCRAQWQAQTPDPSSPSAAPAPAAAGPAPSAPAPRALLPALVDLHRRALTECGRQCPDATVRAQLWEAAAALADRVLADAAATTAAAAHAPHYRRMRTQLIQPFVEEGQIDRAAALAEKFKDFEMLIEMCMKANDMERLYTYIDKYIDEGMAECAFAWLWSRSGAERGACVRRLGARYGPRLRAWLAAAPSRDAALALHSIAARHLPRAAALLARLAAQESRALGRMMVSGRGCGPGSRPRRRATPRSRCTPSPRDTCRAPPRLLKRFRRALRALDEKWLRFIWLALKKTMMSLSMLVSSPRDRTVFKRAARMSRRAGELRARNAAAHQPRLDDVAPRARGAARGPRAVPHISHGLDDGLHARVPPPEDLVQMYIEADFDTLTEYDYKKALDLTDHVQDMERRDDLRLRVWCASIRRDEWGSDTRDELHDKLFFKLVDLVHVMGGDLEILLPPVEDILTAPELAELASDPQFHFLIKYGYESIDTTHKDKAVAMEA